MIVDNKFPYLVRVFHAPRFHDVHSAVPLAIRFDVSHHATQDLQNHSLHSEYDGSEDVMLGDGKYYKITHTGSTLLLSSSAPLNLCNVLCVPHMRKNPIYVYKLCNDNHVSIDFSP